VVDSSCQSSAPSPMRAIHCLFLKWSVAKCSLKEIDVCEPLQVVSETWISTRASRLAVISGQYFLFLDRMAAAVLNFIESEALLSGSNLQCHDRFYQRSQAGAA